MKTTPVLLAAMLLAMPVFVFAQVFNGNLTLSTQAEVDAFNYTEVIGSLIIGNPEEGAPSTDITSLAPLSSLTKVGDNPSGYGTTGLFIVNNDHLQNLQGLDNLSTISFDITIEGNAGLISLQGLESVTSLLNLYIRNNDQLQDLNGLKNLNTVSTINIDNNNQIEDLEGLENAFDNIFVLGTVKITNNAKLNSLKILKNVTSLLELTITNNKQLKNLQGLESLTRINLLNIIDNANLTSLQSLENLNEIGRLLINNNDQIENLPSLDKLNDLNELVIENNKILKNLPRLEKVTNITSMVAILNNASLTSLQGLENLNSIRRFLVIRNNEVLKNLQGLDNLTTISEGLIIENNASLTSLQVLKNLNTLGFLTINNNDQFQNLQGLENLTLIKDGLAISDNDQLQDLQGLDNLFSIGRNSIDSNDQLQDLSDLANLSDMGDKNMNENNQFQQAEVSEDDLIYGLVIIGNDQLQNLQGLDNLTEIDGFLGKLIIEDNASLTSLQGLENLTKVSRENVLIANNPSLTSLEELKNLTTIGTGLEIRNNSALVSLQGLENLQSFVNIAVEDNPVLNDCCAIAALVSKTSGTKSIRDNGSNCNSVEAIQENCPTSFTLIDAVTDQDIKNLDDRTTTEFFNLSETGMQLNIRANVAGQVGSVVFELDGVIVRKENIAPYALFGDEPTGDYHSGMFALGRHTLTATPYDGKNGKGQAGESLTLEFVVIDQPLAVISFFLVTTDNNQVQYELKDGSTISLQQFDNTKLNILANTFPSFVGSVVFSLSKKKVKKFRTENVYPYLLAGDKPPGNYNDYTFTPGTYHLTATPYPMPIGQGEAGNPLSITFEVVENDENQMASARTMPATSSKTKVVEAVEDLSVAQHAAKVWVYPNPSDEVLQVQVAGLRDSQSPITLMLYNPLGKKVWEGMAAANHTSHIEVSHLSGGVYFLKTVGNGYSHIQRILVE